MLSARIEFGVFVFVVFLCFCVFAVSVAGRSRGRVLWPACSVAGVGGWMAWMVGCSHCGQAARAGQAARRDVPLTFSYSSPAEQATTPVHGIAHCLLDLGSRLHVSSCDTMQRVHICSILF